MHVKNCDRLLSFGIFLSIAGLCFFTYVADWITKTGWISTWDIRILQWLHSVNSPLGITILAWVTILGSRAFLSVVAGIGAVLLIRERQWIVLSGWLMALIGGAILENILKLSIRRPRPEFAALFLHHATYSLPSGHAMTSLIAYGMLAYILMTTWVHNPSAKMAIAAAAAFLIIGIGFSRVYLGVHFLTDVIAGYAAGVFWLFLIIRLTHFVRYQRVRRPH
jgi:undecaprenyl-diphosphatase